MRSDDHEDREEDQRDVEMEKDKPVAAPEKAEEEMNETRPKLKTKSKAKLTAAKSKEGMNETRPKPKAKAKAKLTAAKSRASKKRTKEPRKVRNQEPEARELSVEPPPKRRARATAKAAASIPQVFEAPSFDHQVLVKEMTEFGKKIAKLDPADKQTRETIREELMKFPNCKLNIYWSRPACGLGLKSGKDFGYYGWAFNTCWTQHIAVCCKACEILAT